MYDNNITPNTVNEHLLEIRYKANSKVLDYRGIWAEELSLKLDLQNWQITENRVDIFNEDSVEKATERGFVSFRNAGYVMINCSRPDVFLHQALKPIEHLFNQHDVFGKEISITRIGLLTKFGNEYSGNFKTLFRIFKGKFLNPGFTFLKNLEAEATDIGITLDAKHESKNIFTKILTGPMEEEQAKNIFKLHEETPKTFHYFQIDSYQKPESPLNYYSTKKIIQNLTNNNWEYNREIISFLGE